MSGHVKILQLNSNLSKLLDSLCFQLAVNTPDTNSLSLLEIIEWRNNEQITQEQFKQLYAGWLDSKNIHDLFNEKQFKSYPKQDLIQFEGPIKKFISITEITKTLQILNALYNEFYIQRKLKTQMNSSKAEMIKAIQQVQKLFSILDSNGVINLRPNQIFFLTAAIAITQNKLILTNYEQFKQPLKKIMKDMSEIDGNISLRSFKNYFLSKINNRNVKNVISILQQFQYINSTQNNDLFGQKRQMNNSLPQILEETITKWKAYPIFKNKQKKVEFLKRIFQQNQKVIYFNNHSPNLLYQELLKKYGRELLDCIQIDQTMLSEFLQIHQNIISKYMQIIQKTASVLNKNTKRITPKYIDQVSSSQTYINLSTNNNNFQTSIKKKISSNSQFGTAKKNISKTPTKDRTPQKIRKNNHDYNSNNYKNRTPTNKAYTEVHNQFGSAEKKNNTSAYIASGRQTTPTKSTLSFATDIPRTYRAAEKKGLQQNNFYDKLFFFRNKRVQSYQIVMKRLKNK